MEEPPTPPRQHVLFTRIRRVSAELVTVVLGILIALAVNESWNRHIQKVQGNTELLGVRDELESSRRLLASIIRSDSASLRATEAMLGAVANAAGPSIELPDSTYQWLLSTGIYDPPLGRVQSLVASGSLRLIPNLRIRARVASWPGAVAETREHEIRMRDFWLSDVAPYLRSFGYNPQLWTPDDNSIVTLPRSAELGGILHQRQFHARIVAGRHQRLHRGLTTLIALIDSSTNGQLRDDKH